MVTCNKARVLLNIPCKAQNVLHRPLAVSIIQENSNLTVNTTQHEYYINLDYSTSSPPAERIKLKISKYSYIHHSQSGNPFDYFMIAINKPRNN